MAYQDAEKARVRAREYYAANKEKCNSRSAAHYAANKEKRLAQQAAYRKANPEKVAAWFSSNRAKRSEYNAAYRLAAKWGLGPLEVDFLVSAQKGKCGACGVPLDRVGRHVDHCHESNKVRGLLCPPCNLQEGWLRKRNALDLAPPGMKNYLERPPAALLELA